MMNIEITVSKSRPALEHSVQWLWYVASDDAGALHLRKVAVTQDSYEQTCTEVETNEAFVGWAGG
jgi:hypothetical protein